MNTCGIPEKGRTLKRAAGIAGVGAFVALGVLAVTFDHAGSPAATMAGSGAAPTNTTYTQPTVAGMSVAAAPTTTTPAAKAAS